MTLGECSSWSRVGAAAGEANTVEGSGRTAGAELGLLSSAEPISSSDWLADSLRPLTPLPTGGGCRLLLLTRSGCPLVSAPPSPRPPAALLRNRRGRRRLAFWFWLVKVFLLPSCVWHAGARAVVPTSSVSLRCGALRWPSGLLWAERAPVRLRRRWPLGEA